VDAVANRLPSWRASMLNRAGRLELIRSTLAAIPIFAMLSLDIQIETLLAIEKILCGYRWSRIALTVGGWMTFRPISTP
jgi:hypothetical protein